MLPLKIMRIKRRHVNKNSVQCHRRTKDGGIICSEHVPWRLKVQSILHFILLDNMPLYKLAMQ